MSVPGTRDRTKELGAGQHLHLVFFGSVVESVDTPDLKSVGHYGRASSSLATPTSILFFIKHGKTNKVHVS